MKTRHNGSPHYQSAAETPAEQVMTSPGLLLETLQHHFVIVAGTCALVLIGVYIYLDHMTPLYTSTARVYVQKEVQVSPGDSERGVMTEFDNYLYTQAEVLKSVPVLESAVALLDAKPMLTLADYDDRVAALRWLMTADVGKMDGIINVAFKSPYPEEAADIVNAVVDAYIGFHGQQKRSAAAALLDIIQKERKDRSAEVLAKQQQIVQFRRENKGIILGSNRDDNIVTRRVEALLTQLSEAQLATIQAKFLCRTAETMADDPVGLAQFLEAWQGRGVGGTTTDKAATLQAELKRMERNKADVLLELKPNHPAVVAVDSEIERVRQEMADLNQQFVQHQLMATRQIEEELTRQYEAQRQRAAQLDDLQTQYAVLQSDYEQAKRLCDVLDERIKELRVTEEVGGLTVTVLERGQVAALPSEPRKVRAMAITLFLGGCAGMGLGVVRELSDKRIRSARQIAALLHLPILGIIPAMKSFMRSGTLRAKMVRVCPTSREAEAFRRLRTPLLFGPRQEGARTIVVTSPMAGEGKSLVVSNLATAIAQTGQKVLIVDADCHAPSQHQIFNKGRHIGGLSTVLTGHTTLEEAIEPTGTENLDILTCGPTVPNSTEMLAGERWPWAVKTLAKQYDLVLIDSPPLLSLTDAQVLAAHCDGVVLVLRADSSTRRDSLRACDELTAVGARILGVVINGVPWRRNRYCHRYDYSYNPYGRPGEALLPGRAEMQGAEDPMPLARVFERHPEDRNGQTKWGQRWD